MDSKKIARIGKDCVACGVCYKQCPKSALSINKGIHAAVAAEICIGCGKCARSCPASVIKIVERVAS